MTNLTFKTFLDLQINSIVSSPLRNHWTLFSRGEGSVLVFASGLPPPRPPPLSLRAGVAGFFFTALSCPSPVHRCAALSRPSPLHQPFLDLSTFALPPLWINVGVRSLLRCTPGSARALSGALLIAPGALKPPPRAPPYPPRRKCPPCRNID